MILLVGVYQKTWGLNAGRSFPFSPGPKPLEQPGYAGSDFLVGIKMQLAMYLTN